MRRGAGRAAEGGAAADRRARRAGRPPSPSCPRSRTSRRGGRQVTGDRLEAALRRPAPEAFGVWPSGEFLFGTSDVGLDAWQLFAAIGLIAFGFAAVVDEARRLRAAGGGRRRRGDLPRHALEGRPLRRGEGAAVPASLVMALILGALLLPRRGGAAAPRPADPEPEAAPAGQRAAGHRPPGADRGAVHRAPRLLELPRPPRRGGRADDRFDELEAFRDEVEGKSVLALTSDRYTDYYLRGAEVRSPAKTPSSRSRGGRARTSASRSTSTPSTPATSTSSTTRSPRTPSTRAARRRTSRRWSAPSPTSSGSGTGRHRSSASSPRRPARAGSSAATRPKFSALLDAPGSRSPGPAP